MEANLAIATRQRVRDDEDFAALLDRMGFDLFLGTGLPIESIPGKRNPSTVRLLETESGWIQVYRNLRSAIYLRRDARNAENLTRVRDYYAAAGVPFDPRTGFDPERAIAAAAGWAVEQGIVPRDFPRLLESVRGASARRLATPEMHRLATLYATLGLYERALEVDRRILRANRADAEAARRMLWCLLHLRRVVEALEIARDLESGPLAGVASAGWIATLERIREAAPDERARLLAFIPLFRSDRASSIRSGMVLPRARERVLARR
jgi:hypothetical protein